MAGAAAEETATPLEFVMDLKTPATLASILIGLAIEPAETLPVPDPDLPASEQAAPSIAPTICVMPLDPAAPQVGVCGVPADQFALVDFGSDDFTGVLNLLDPSTERNSQ